MPMKGAKGGVNSLPESAMMSCEDEITKRQWRSLVQEEPNRCQLHGDDNRD